jgi:large subunit ribosomal protein L18
MGRIWRQIKSNKEVNGMGAVSKAEARTRRKKRVRKKVRGSSERPRLCVFRSSRHIYAQLIDDIAGRTLAHASTLSKDISSKLGSNTGNRQAAAAVGTTMAELAIKAGIKTVVFDRNGFLYHGRVEALAEAAREHGLEF